MNQTAIFKFSTIAAAALLTACSGAQQGATSAKAGTNSESVAQPITIDENNKTDVAAASAGAIEQATDGGLSDFSGTVGVANFGKSQIAAKQSPMEALGCDSGSGDVTETATQITGTFNNCVLAESDGQGGFGKLSIDGGFTITEDGDNFSAQFDALTYGLISEFEGQSSEVGFIFFGSLNGTDDGSKETITFNQYGLNFYADVEGETNFDGHFRYHKGSIEYVYAADPQTLTINDLSFSTNFAGEDAQGENVVVDRFSITINTPVSLKYPSNSSTPTSGVIEVRGTNTMTIDFATGNPTTADVTVNGSTEEVSTISIGF